MTDAEATARVSNKEAKRDITRFMDSLPHPPRDPEDPEEIIIRAALEEETLGE